MAIVRKRILLRTLLFMFLSISLHNYGWSQLDQGDPWSNEPGDVGSNDPGEFAAGDPGDPGEDPDLPIDTNILVLVAAVVGYGVKKWWDVKQNVKRKGLQTTANYEDYVK